MAESSFWDRVVHEMALDIRPFQQGWADDLANPCHIAEWLQHFDRNPYNIDWTIGHSEGYFCDLEIAELIFESIGRHLDIAPLPDLLEEAVLDSLRRHRTRPTVLYWLRFFRDLVGDAESQLAAEEKRFSLWLQGHGLFDGLDSDQSS